MPALAFHIMLQSSNPVVFSVPLHLLHYHSGDQMNECTEGGDANRHMFVSGITLHIPNSTIIKRKGDRRPDKKSSQDSAALTMLYELEKLGRCQIEVQQPAERIS